MKGQKDRILHHLRDYGEIDQLQALAEYGIMRLASRVEELRREVYPIITERVEGRNRYGEKCHWAKYKMGGKL